MVVSKPKVKWLDRRIGAPGPYLCLCLSEGEYLKALSDLDLKPVCDWIKNEHASATVHHVCSPQGNAAIVCMRGWENCDPIEVAGLLIHESVHIWQEWCEYYGEANPGCEQEAYAIQALSQELMAEFARRVNG